MTLTGRSGSTGSAPQPDPPKARASAVIESVPGYRELARIGHGGFSVVYRAVQESFERPVALKVLTVGTDEEARRRFLREMRLAGRLSGHPHVVTILDAGATASGRPYLAMDLYDGGSMKERLKQSGPLSAAQTAMVGAKIADALAAAHSLGVLHRDVTPNNILVSKFGEPALADFGVSCLLDSASSASVIDIFSPQHAAPELMTRGVPTAASDVYALGSTLYQLLTGHSPFGGESRDVRAIMWRVVSEPPPWPDCPELPELAEAIVRAMAKEPGQRFPDAAEFARTLRALIPDGTPSALPMPYPSEALSAGQAAATAVVDASAANSTSDTHRPSAATSGRHATSASQPDLEANTSTYGRLSAPDETMLRPDRADPELLAAPPGRNRGGRGDQVEDDDDARRRRRAIPVIVATVVALIGVGTWALLDSQNSSAGKPTAAASQHATVTAAAYVTPTRTPARPKTSSTPKPRHSTVPAGVTDAPTQQTAAPPSAPASASASASSTSGGSLLPLPGTFHQLQNVQAGSCLAQSGGSGAAPASCAGSSAEGWQYSLSLNGLLAVGADELVNKQSGSCLAETSNGQVGVQACDGSSGQLWSITSGSGSGKEFQNAGDRQCLQVAGAVVSVGSCSTGNRAALWNEDGTS